jgi:hypothetical protein
MNKKIAVGFLAIICVCTTHSMARRRAVYYKGPIAPALQEHRRIQKEFMGLQKEVGIPVASEKEVNEIKKPEGKQHSTQAQFNQVRKKLNTLLSKKAPLSDDDLAEVMKNIRILNEMYPARWPRPFDYEKILERKRVE